MTDKQKNCKHLMSGEAEKRDYCIKCGVSLLEVVKEKGKPT